MSPPCLAGVCRRGATSRSVAAAHLLGAVALTGMVMVMVVQTVVALHLQRVQRCSIGMTVVQDDWSGCNFSYSFFGGVHVERFVMMTMASMGLVLPLTWATILMWKMLRAMRCWCEAMSAADLVASFWSSAAVLMGRGEDARVWQQANKQRVRQARACLHMVSLAVLPIIFLTSLIIFHPKATNPQPDRGFILQYLFHSEGPPLMFLAIIGTAVHASPSIVTPRGLNFINTFFAIVWSWRYAVMSESWYMFNHTWMLVLRSVQGMVCGNARLTILLQGIITVVELTYIAINAHKTTRTLWTVSRDILVFLVISILNWTFEQRQLAEARALLQSFRSDRATQLVQRLLSGMCEAVVRLDGQLRIVEPSPRLSSLLLRQGPLGPGMHFTDLMSDEDAKRVRACLEAEAEKQVMVEVDEENEEERSGNDYTPAQVLHIHLKDGNGSKLRVELFYSCLPDMDGQPSLLVGVTEDRECQIPLEERAEALPESTLTRVPEQVRLTVLPEDSCTGCQSHSSWSLAEGDEALQVCIDTQTSELKVLSTSSDFALLGGAAGPCNNLEDWLSTEDFSRFSAWVACMESDADSACRSCSVTLRPPNCNGSYRVVCEPGMVAPSLAHAGSKPMSVLLERPTFKPCPSQNTMAAAVDRVMSEAERRHSRERLEAQGSARSSASSSTERSERSNRECEDWTLLWFTICSRRLRILKIEGASLFYRTKFAKKKHLRDWLERPDEFLEILKRALVDHELGVCEDLPRKLGKFVLTQPGTEVDRCRFVAKLSLVDISDDGSADYPCCVGVQPCRDLPLLPDSKQPPPNCELQYSTCVTMSL